MSLVIPKFRLPEIIARMGRKLPQWPHTLHLVGSLNLALTLKWLPADELGLLEDKCILVRVLDTGGEARFSYRNGLFRPLFNNQAPDLTFCANLSAYLQLLTRQEDPDTLFFNRELEITGDTELGLFVKNMLDALEFPPSDWRERLPKLPGFAGRH